MVITNINPVGNFDCWSPKTLLEVHQNQFSEEIGRPLFENSEFKLWQINLKPGERLPFRRHNKTYSCNCLTDGLLLSRNVNGAIDMIRFDRGETYFRECPQEAIHDLENIGDVEVQITIVEEKLRCMEPAHQL